MDTTDRTHRLGLPYLANDQAQKHVTVNEGLRALDALVQMTAVSAATDAEPADPAPGDAYLMTAARTGAAWSGFAEDDIAAFQDGAWAGFAPTVGMTVWVQDEGAHRVWDGAAWKAASAGGGGGPAEATGAVLFGINAEADATNRLTVKSDAVLHSHDDASGTGTGDARHAINKASPANTASLVFQSNWSGRAEMGLTGSDDFAFKVSADGVSFVDAITIDRTTGAVSLPNTQATGGGSSGPETITRLVTTAFVKTSDTDRTAIPDLSGIVLPAGSRWRLAMMLLIEGPSGADSNMQLAFDQPDADAAYAEADQNSRFDANAANIVRLDTEEARRGTAQLMGLVAAGAADTVMDVLWAQRIADAGPSTVHPLSHIVLTRLD